MDYFTSVIRAYSQKGVIVDTNLLLLYLVGSYNIDLVERCKRTTKYSVEDFEIVATTILRFKAVIITPHILTEVSSFAKDVPDKNLSAFFASFVSVISSYDEKIIPMGSIFKSKYLSRFGVTDIGIHQLSSSNAYLVFTDDFPLVHFLGGMGVDVLNLNDMRTALWLQK